MAIAEGDEPRCANREGAIGTQQNVKIYYMCTGHDMTPEIISPTMECTRRHCNALPSSSSSSFSSPSSSSYPISSPLESITSLFSLSRPPPSPSLPPLTPPSSSRSSLILSYLPPSIASPIQAITSTRTGVAVLSATSATVLTAGTILCYRRYWKRIRTADYVTQGMLNRKRWIKGVVTR